MFCAMIYLKVDVRRKTEEHEDDEITDCSWFALNGNQRKNWVYPDHSIVKIDKNTEKSPGVLRRLIVTQSPLKDHQQTLVRKPHTE